MDITNERKKSIVLRMAERLRDGQSEKQVRKYLSYCGWDESDIEYYIKQANKILRGKKLMGKTLQEQQTKLINELNKYADAINEIEGTNKQWTYKEMSDWFFSKELGGRKKGV